MKRLNNGINIYIFLEFIFCLFIIFFTINKNDSIVSSCISLTFIVLFSGVIHLVLKQKMLRKDLINLFLLTSIITISFCAVIKDINSFSFSYYKKYLIFISTILYIYLLSKISCNKNTVKFILSVNIILSALFIFNYFFGIKNYMGGGLTFNFTNPNLVAMWLLNISIFLILGIVYYKNNKLKAIFTILLFFIVIFIIETRSRTCLVTLFVFIIFTVFLNKRIKPLGRVIIFLLIIFPIIFVMVYMMMIKNGDINFIQFLDLEGKSIYSRQLVWGNGLAIFYKNPLLGGYYEASHGTGMSQMHNSHLDILVSYGSIVFGLCIVFITRVCYEINLQIKSKFQLLSLIGFLSIITMGFGEAALFSGGIGIYILGCSFLLIAKYY